MPPKKKTPPKSSAKTTKVAPKSAKVADISNASNAQISTQTPMGGAPQKMGFFKTLASSIYGPEFYASIPKGRSLGQALGYFLLVALLYSLLMVGLLVLAFVNFVDVDSGKIIQTTKDLYPQELIVTVDQGKVVTNVVEPYFIGVPEGWGKMMESEEASIDQLMVIDTKTPFSIEQMNAYKSLIWVTSDSFFYVDPSDGTVEGTVIDQTAAGEVTKEKFDTLIDEIAVSAKQLIPVILLVGWLGIFIFSVIWNMLYLLFLALLILIVGSVMSREINYGQSYKIGLYAMTVVYAAQLILMALTIWTPVQGFKLLITLIAVVMVIVNFRQRQES